MKHYDPADIANRVITDLSKIILHKMKGLKEFIENDKMMESRLLL